MEVRALALPVLHCRSDCGSAFVGVRPCVLIIRVTRLYISLSVDTRTQMRGTTTPQRVSTRRVLTWGPHRRTRQRRGWRWRRKKSGEHSSRNAIGCATAAAVAAAGGYR
eukprot:GHVU01156861.1.p2 GENE.GHVU01156861.1~~GHVU01156861.1.p2  ORF type:complete len:109 (+),score=9.03 GHVU01156861.1:245-571(+)